MASTRRRVPVWVRVVLWTVGTALVLVAAAAAWVITMFSGGLDDLIGDARAPDDPAVVEAYERTRPENVDALNRTVSAFDEAVAEIEVLGSAEGDRCRQGQHNWKIDDPFDLWCSLTDATLVLAGPLPGFRADMVALDTHLTGQGWTGDTFDIPYVLSEYWDDGDVFGAADPDRSYPYGMPSVGYTRGEEQLSIDWAVHARAGPYGSADGWVDVTGGSTALETLAARVPEGRYGLMVTMTRDYFYE